MIYIVMKGVPPSANKAYWDNPKGGRILTTAGKAYKRDTVQYIVKNHANQTRELRKNATISCLIAYGFHNMMNMTWPEKADWRYKRLDLSNRAKLLQDAIVEATAIDDSQICFDFSYKYHAEEDLTTIYIWNEDEEPFGQRLLASFESIIRGPRPL